MPETKAAKKQLIKLTRVVDGHLVGETYRVTPEEREALGINEGDFETLDEKGGSDAARGTDDGSKGSQKGRSNSGNS